MQYLASITLLVLGGLIATLNAWILISQIRGKHSPSAAPFIGGIFLLVGGLLYPNGSLRPWAVIGLFIDYGCMPYLIFATIYLIQEKLRYRDKNRILTLKYASDLIAGEIAIYPKNECIYKWKQRNGQSYGSMVIKVVGFEPDRSISLALDQLSLQLTKNSGKWSLEHEEGWHDPMYSLQGADISEKAANKALHRTL